MIKVALTTWILDKCINVALDRMINNLKPVDATQLIISTVYDILRNSAVNPIYKHELNRSFNQWLIISDSAKITNDKVFSDADVAYFKNKLNDQLMRNHRHTRPDGHECYDSYGNRL